MSKKLEIKGIIADNTHDYDENEVFTLNDAIKFFAGLNDGESVDIVIDSPGGSVYAGDNIYMLIKNECKNRYITMTAVGICHSIATKIYLAVPKEQRYIDAECEFLIHLPLVVLSEGEMMNRLLFDELSEMLGTVEKNLVTLYEQNSNLDKEIITLLMEQEISFSAEMVLDYGFASKITTDNNYIDKITNFNKNILIINDMKKSNKSFAKFFVNFKKTFLNSSKGRVMVDMTLKATDIDGTDVTIETPYEDLITGDPALIGNEKAIEGDYTLTESAYDLPVGTVIKIGVDGDVMEVIKPGSEGPQNVTEEEAENTVEKLEATVQEFVEIIQEQQIEIETKDEEIEKLEAEIVNLKAGRPKPSGSARSVKNMTDQKGLVMPSLLGDDLTKERKAQFSKK